MTPVGSRDPARQPERTRLSWRRTVLAATVVVLLAVRLAVHEQPTGIRVAGVALAMLGWLVVVAFSWRRIRTLAAAAPPPSRWSASEMSLITVGYAALGVLLVAVAH